MSAAAAIAKINEDFSEALPFWKDHFDRWIFTHNSRDGLGPDILKRLLDLGQENQQFVVGSCGFPELRLEVFKLSLIDIAHLLGPAPSRKTFSELRFDKLEPVILAIARKEPVSDPQIRPVPKEKLYHNGLSHSVEILLRAGMAKSDLVADFFSKWPDPKLGDEVAASFFTRYEDLKKAELAPDLIFYQLQSFAGGGNRGTPENEAAVLAVLAHLFEECDIFEALGVSGDGTR
ncbi:MAG: hypothetical protein KCHDKBKB_01635 [Elusimicrobia bacterium]|nr:hypothetical protein [Elusimicrobiota bacterium]